ncbi:MAG: hypothetical protein NC915_05300 [Candidatus Omnitrophica bacterium]|nr:hypothetical protein [Candidatus Omnitrophota bacterium]
MKIILRLMSLCFLFFNYGFGKSICEEESFKSIYKAESPITIISEENTPTKYTFQIPAIKQEKDMIVVMRFKARLHTESPGGWNNYLGIEINGKNLDKYTSSGYYRLVNRTGSFKTTIGENDWWGKRSGYPTIIVYFGNGKELDQRVISHREEGYWYLLNISDAVNYVEIGADERIEKAEPNKITLINTYLNRYVPGAKINMIIEDLEIGYLPKYLIEKYSKPELEKYGEFKEKEKLETKGYQLGIGEKGEIEIKVGNERYKLVSGYSYPGNIIGFNWFDSSKKGEINWKVDIKKVGKEFEIKGEGENYIITRKIKPEQEKIKVEETIKNKSYQEIGIIVTHRIILDDLPSYYRIGGVEEIEFSSRGVAENPTIFVSYKNTSIGFVAEDNILRVQGEIEKKVNTLNYSIKHFGLDKNKEYKFEFSIYPLNEVNYFTFINKVRNDWGVNTKIEGPFAFSSEVINERKIKIYVVGPWLDYYDINPETGKSYTREEYKNRIKPVIEKIKSLEPNAKILGKIETNLISIDKRDIQGGEILPGGSLPRKGTYGYILDKKQSEILKSGIGEWKDSILQTEEGNVIVDTYYPTNPNFLNLLLYLDKGNYRYKHFLKQIDFLIDEVGMDGVYIDQFTLTWGQIGRPDRHTYEKWDGYTVDIDEKTGKIKRKYTDCGLIGAEARKEILEYITKKGKIAVINGFPGVKEEQVFPNIFRFAEFENDPVNPLTFMDKKPPTLIYCAKGHLSTPIILGIRPARLGDEGNKRFAEIIMKSVITALRNGLLYYYYSSVIPKEGPGAGEYGPINHMFPITIKEINEGYIIGEERIISCVSRVFEFNKEPKVYLFDLKGRGKPHNFKVEKKGTKWQIEVKLSDWNEICIIE